VGEQVGPQVAQQPTLRNFSRPVFEPSTTSPSTFLSA